MVDDRQIIVVGAGITGLTLAERIANVTNKRVLIMEKRNQIGGNCYDFFDNHGVLISKYGPHVFHTEEDEVYEYVKRFAKWEKYEHRVSSMVNGKLVPIPVNIETINILFGTNLQNGEEMKKWLDERKVRSIKIPLNGEEVILSKLGRELYELMFKSFTKKQWGLWPRELEVEVLARIPVKYNFDRGYNLDKYQIRPMDGYTRMMENMVDNPNIEIKLNTDFFKQADKISNNALIFFTGPVDEFVSFKTGKKYRLPYRSVKFLYKSFHKEYFQKVGVINYPSLETKILRSTEYKYLTGQKHNWTTISEEHFYGGGEPLYPIKSIESKQKYEEIKKVTKKWKDIYFVGRLGRYEYLNMDRAIKEALDLFKSLTGKW